MYDSYTQAAIQEVLNIALELTHHGKTTRQLSASAVAAARLQSLRARFGRCHTVLLRIASKFPSSAGLADLVCRLNFNAFYAEH